MPKKSIIFFAFIIFPLVIGLACRFTSRLDPTATPRPVIETAEEVAAVPTYTPTPEPIAEEEEIEEVISPSFGIVEGFDKSMWMQDGMYVYVAFLYENESSDILYEDVMFTVSLFNEGGELLYDEYFTTPWLFPEQKVGMFYSIWIEEDMDPVADVGIFFSYAETTAPGEMDNPFTTDSIVYWPEDGFAMVTGKIVNNDATTYTDIQVYSICYDSAGDIVGGGFTYVDFIHLEDYMGFTMYVDTVADVASVEVFPLLSYSTRFIDKTDFLSEISILDYYFYENEWGELVGGFIARNETDTVLGDSLVFITFYNDQENVTATATAYIDLLLPGDTLGIAPWVTTPPMGADTTWLDVLILPGEQIDDYELDFNPFRVNSTSVAGNFDEYVMVSFTNTYNKQVSELDIYVLVYNDDGLIIGGGWDWTRDPISAGETAEIEVWVTYADAETIATIEAWVVPSFWTDFD